MTGNTHNINPSLENVAAVCEAAGNPQRSFAVVQVAGTNGKTSTARLISALLREEGLRTGLYTSPELMDETERIVIDGTPITRNRLDGSLATACDVAADIGITLTEFERYTVACFLALRAAAVDFAVLEVGLGGKWDATSVARPAVAVITGIALDHTQLLGDTVEEIAADKAHIIKPGATVVLGESVSATAPIFCDRARQMGAPIYAVVGADETFYGGLDPVSRSLQPAASCTKQSTGPEGDSGLKAGMTDTATSYSVTISSPFLTTFTVTTPHARYDDLTLHAPAYQASNAATAITAVEAVLGRALNPAAVRAACATTTFPGRFELIRKQPPLIFDGAHNPQAVQLLAAQVRQLPYQPTIALGVLADKDVNGIVDALTPLNCPFIPLTPPSPRALPALELAQIIKRRGGAVERPPTESTLKEAATQPLLITGSLTLYPLIHLHIS